MLPPLRLREGGNKRKCGKKQEKEKREKGIFLGKEEATSVVGSLLSKYEGKDLCDPPCLYIILWATRFWHPGFKQVSKKNLTFCPRDETRNEGNIKGSKGVKTRTKGKKWARRKVKWRKSRSKALFKNSPSRLFMDRRLFFEANLHLKRNFPPHFILYVIMCSFL